MIEKVYAVFAAILLLVGSTNGQNSIKGKVIGEGDQPLIGAAVVLQGTSLGVVTDESGEFELTKLSDGKYTVVFSFLGYQSKTRIVELSGADIEINIELQVNTFVSEAFTVTAVRASKDEPVSQVTRGLKSIENRFQGQDASFLLEKLSPSIVTYSESGTNFSNYSGFRLRGMDQTRINMTLNGVPLNDMIDQGVFFSNFTDFGNSIQSVQIQRGAGTSSNGVSSYAGSINFESINVYDTVPSIEVQLTAGSFNTYRASAELKTGKMENNFAFYARYAGMISDGYRDNTSTDSRSFFLSGAYFGKKHTFKFTGFLGRSKNGLAYSPVSIRDIEANPRTNYISPNDIDDFGQWMTQIQHNYAISMRASLTNTIYYNGAGGDFPFGFDTEDGSFSQINFPLFNEHIGAMSQLNWSSVDNSLRLNFGLHGYTFKRENLEQFIPFFDDPYYEDESQKDEFSAFAKARKSFGRLTIFGDIQLRAVNLSLRPDTEFLGDPLATIDDRTWTFINPRVGLTYKINERLSAYLSAGRTGREPTRFDILGSTQINAGNIMIAQDENSVDPEFVNDFELGVKVSGTDFSLNLNGFFMQFENEIAPIGEFIPEGFVQVYENQESSFRAGVELDYSWMISDQLTLFGNATFMQSQISEYTPEGSEDTFENITPILSPDWNVQTSLEFEIIDDLFISVRSRYLSESFLELTNNSDLKVPESIVIDAGLRYTILGKHQIKVDFNNLLDELYYVNGAPVIALDGTLEPGYFVQPPFNFAATIVLRF